MRISFKHNFSGVQLKSRTLPVGATPSLQSWATDPFGIGGSSATSRTLRASQGTSTSGGQPPRGGGVSSNVQPPITAATTAIALFAEKLDKV